jgi:hypothetical protein
MTEKELKKRCCWWWREKGQNWTFDGRNFTTKEKRDSANQTWKDQEELVAWYYELARRHIRSDESPPFPQAKDSLAVTLLDDFNRIKPRLQVLRINLMDAANDPTITRKRSWSDFLQCDLEAPDNQIFDSLRDYLKSERAKRKLKMRRGAEGKRHRPVSWRWPELMDIATLVENPRLNDADRSKLSKARKLSKTLHEYLVDGFTPSGDEI